MSATKRNQRNNILAKLIAARGKEVPLPEITALASQYQARLYELRRLGFSIPPPRTETVNGQRHTWYRLENWQSHSDAAESLPSKPATLFGDLTPFERHRDLG